MTVLRPLRIDDAPAHLAGEDEELWRWLTDGHPGTPATVAAFIERNIASWRAGGPIRNFGVWDEATGELVGNVEANLAEDHCGPGEANVSYAIWPAHRRRGHATRAVELMCADLAEHTSADTVVLRIEPANTLSLAVARRCGFVEVAATEPKYLRFARRLRAAPETA